MLLLRRVGQTVVILVTVCLCVYGFHYMREVGAIDRFLQWLQNIDKEQSMLIMVFLFVFTGLPISWGYLVLNIGAGFLYGLLPGFIVTVVGANLSALVSFQMCRYFFKGWIERRIQTMDTLKAIRQVMVGPRAFKIILLTRLTPIPFGLQNSLFSLSPISTYKYCLATCIGLLPTQIFNTYAGTTLNDITDVMSGKKKMDASAYIIAATQIAAGVGLTYAVVVKARSEMNSMTSHSNTNLAENDTEVAVVNPMLNRQGTEDSIEMEVL